MSFAIKFVISICALTGLCEGATLGFTYRNQGNWGGVCVRGNRVQQSPINIITSAVQRNFSLASLHFNNAWYAPSSGKLKNTGNTVKFIPATLGAARIVTPNGLYELQQFHLHWGPRTGTGSEHRINGSQSELEIHFVHFRKQRRTNSQRDFAAVIGVLADVDRRMRISSPWAKLDISAIQPNGSSPVAVTGLVLSDLLPNNTNYYYYQGSLTTPPCGEIVQWFLLKEKIRVPAAFVSQLRRVQQPDGQNLDSNFRDTQPLGSRIVMEGSQMIDKPVGLVTFISISFARQLTL